MPPKKQELYTGSKNKNTTASERANYHRTAPNNRYKRDVQEVTRLLEQYATKITVNEAGIFSISCRTKSAAHQFSAVLNRFSYVIEENDGRIARQKDDIYILITSKHYQTILKKFAAHLIPTLSKIKKTSNPVIKSIATTDLFVYGEEISKEERKAYHDKNPDRYRRDANVLKIFFNEVFVSNQDMLTITIADKEKRHGIIRALNNFSYCIRNTDGKTAMSQDDVISIPKAYFNELKPYILSLDIQDQRTITAVVTAEERRKYHQSHPERKNPDCNALKQFLTQINTTQRLSVQYSDEAKVKNMYQAVNRCAYFIEKGSVVTKDNLTVTMAEAADFNALFTQFFPTETNQLLAKATKKPCLADMTRKQNKAPKAAQLVKLKATNLIKTTTDEQTESVKTLDFKLDEIFTAKPPQATPIEDFIFENDDDPLLGDTISSMRFNQ